MNMKRTISRLLSCLILALWAGPPLRAATTDLANALPGEVLVSLQNSLNPGAVIAQLEASVGTVIGYIPATGTCLVRLRDDLSVAEALDRLRSLVGVRTAEPNHLVWALAMPDDPLYRSQYALKLIQADLAWQIWLPRSPVVIAIVDSGIDSNHPDLANKIYRDETGTIGYNTFTNQQGDAFDDYHHGTHCAGIAAAQVNNGIGISGIAGWDGMASDSDASSIKLMPVKVLNHAGYGDDWRVGQGITWAADHGARVISLSLALDGPLQAVEDAVRYAIRKGCVVVAAAGNEATSNPVYPAAYSGVISVAATDDHDNLTGFSNYGSWVRTAAPGVSICSTLPTPPSASPAERASSRYYGLLSGTSMACPHVAGEVALLLAHNPSLSVSQVSAVVTSNVDAYTPYQGRMLASGAGRINVYRALQAASRISVEPAALVSIGLASTTLTSGSSTTARLFLSGPAPQPGAVIHLSSSDTTLVTVPDDVIIPAGLFTGTFSLTTQPVSTSTPLVISATYGDLTRTVDLTLVPERTNPSAVTLSPSSVTGGGSVQGRVTLGAAAPKGGIEVLLSANDAAIAGIPDRVTVPAGARSAIFPIKTQAVREATPVLITATRKVISVSSTLTVLAPVLTQLTMRPALVRRGNKIVGQVTLSGPAPAGGTEVALACDNPGVATVPTSVTVPAGLSTATFPVSTQPGDAVSLTITANLGGLSKTAILRTLRSLSLP
jgi:thermitase